MSDEAALLQDIVRQKALVDQLEADALAEAVTNGQAGEVERLTGHLTAQDLTAGADKIEAVGTETKRLADLVRRLASLRAGRS